VQPVLSEPEREMLETVWDDAYGLYELGRPVFTSRRWDGKEVLIPTVETIEALISKGLVCLSRLRYEPKSPEGRDYQLAEEAAVPTHEVEAVMADPLSWEGPRQSNEAYFALEITDAGRKLMKEIWALENPA
jgi:hypothetical protein